MNPAVHLENFRLRIVFRKIAALIFMGSVLFATQFLIAQAVPYERSFPQSKSVIEKTLKTLASATSGRLPVLDGFVIPGDRSLDNFRRAFYQCDLTITPKASGGSQVKVVAKITAWYTDPTAAKSGYQILPSNGRLEADLLDQIGDALTAQTSAAPARTSAASKPRSASNASSDTSGSLISAPVPRIPDASANAGAANQNQNAQNQPASLRGQTEAAEKRAQELATEARNLEEILNNQTRPANLAAVKKSGTAVVATPAADAKVLFTATAGDEFEILDENPEWVHLRISGLSRGWIRRSSLEMPGDTAAQSKNSADSGPAFQIGSEQFGAFPGDWAPLRGKTVKIISVQKSNENAPNTGPAQKAEFTKALFTSEYDKISSTAEGIVVIFDSDDGGMVAATLPALQQWKSGSLSDEAFWHQCFFDPPEILTSAATPTK